MYTIPLADLGASKVLLKDIVIHDATESNQPALYVDSVQLVAAVQPPFTGAITYDANGNMLTKGEQCYEYNQANQLSKVKTCGSNQTVAEYIYGFDGIRLIKKNYLAGSLVNTVISWTKGFETKDIVGGSVETTNYYFANDEVVGMRKPDGTNRYFHNDHLGSTGIITNQSGIRVEGTDFGAWGETTNGGTESKYQYTGQENDAETGLNYMNARYYSPELKHFTQPDTLIQDVYDPQMLNRYSYARNNPLKYTDPSGNAIVIQNGRIVSTIAVLNSKPAAPKPQNYQQFVQSASRSTGNTQQNQQNRTTQNNNTGGNSGGGSNGNNNSNPAAAIVPLVVKSLISQNYANGYAFQYAVQEAAGFAKNTTGLGPEYGNRIPDGWQTVNEKQYLQECKAVQYVCMTSQLRDMFRYAGDKKAVLDLYIKDGGKVASTVYKSAADVGRQGGTVNVIKTTITVGAAGASAVFISQ